MRIFHNVIMITTGIVYTRNSKGAMLLTSIDVGLLS